MFKSVLMYNPITFIYKGHSARALGTKVKVLFVCKSDHSAQPSVKRLLFSRTDKGYDCS